jgi:hypothetical protein
MKFHSETRGFVTFHSERDGHVTENCSEMMPNSCNTYYDVAYVNIRDWYSGRSLFRSYNRKLTTLRFSWFAFVSLKICSRSLPVTSFHSYRHKHHGDWRRLTSPVNAVGFSENCMGLWHLLKNHIACCPCCLYIIIIFCFLDIIHCLVFRSILVINSDYIR